MLKEVFYEDGSLFWKEQNKNRSRKMNSPIGSPANGYLVTSYKNKTKYIHRIVWELFYGDIPNGMTADHIDGNKINNKIENRAVCLVEIKGTVDFIGITHRRLYVVLVRLRNICKL